MGRGIASQFRSRYGSISLLSAQNPAVGSLVKLPISGRYIFYLVTKRLEIINLNLFDLNSLDYFTTNPQFLILSHLYIVFARKLPILE